MKLLVSNLVANKTSFGCRFIWSEDDGNEDSLTWEQRLAKKYWQKLYHEYCITGLAINLFFICFLDYQLAWTTNQ